MRVYLDDRRVFELWGCCPNTGTTGNFCTVGAGMHRLRIDYYQEMGPAYLKLICVNGCPATVPVTLPLSYVGPRYGLVTASRDADGKRTVTQYAKAGDVTPFNVAVARGLPRMSPPILVTSTRPPRTRTMSWT